MKKKSKHTRTIKPSPSDVGAIRIAIMDDDDMRTYKTEPLIKKLRKENRISVWGGELWVYEGDKSARKTAKSWFGGY